MKKAFALVLALLMMGALLAGCTGNTASSTPASTAPASSAGASEPEVVEQTLKVAALESAYGAERWQAVADAFEAANPGVTVELTIDKNIEDVIGPSMQAGDYPDVIHVAQGREKALPETFIKDNQLENLTDVLDMEVPGEGITVKDKIVPGFTESSLTNPYNDGQTYLMPMFYSPCGLFYNAGLFAEKEWDLPTNWEEMWALAETAGADGISLFAYPTTGYFDAFFYGMLATAGGNDFFNRAMRYEEGIWDTDEAQAVFDVIGELAQNTEATVPANANGDNYTKNQQLILDNQAIFCPNGTWLPGEMADAPRADGFEWGFMALPALEDGGQRYSYTFFEQCWMPAGAENKDLGKQFIAYLYSDEAAAIFADSSLAGDAAYQPVAGVTDYMSDDAKVMYGVYDAGANGVMGNFAPVTVEGVEVNAVFFAPIDSLVTGAKTLDQYVEDIKAASDQLRAALEAA